MEFKVDDRVIDMLLGDGTIHRINNNKKYPIIVKYNNGSFFSYTINGYLFPYSKQSLYPYGYTFDIKVIRPKRKIIKKVDNNFEKEELVLVRDEVIENWEIASFYEYNSLKTYKYRTTKSAFKCCIPYEGNEWARNKITDEYGYEV